MSFAVRYYSRSGNTQKIAEAIASVLNVPAQKTTVPLDQPVDTLFLGSALYAGKIHADMENFIQSLSKDKVKRIVVFSTSASPNTPNADMQELFKQNGITVSEKTFHCPGKFLFFNRKRPNAQDLQDAQTFAQSFL